MKVASGGNKITRVLASEVEGQRLAGKVLSDEK
jgi:hypothetical protein